MRLCKSVSKLLLSRNIRHLHYRDIKRIYKGHQSRKLSANKSRGRYCDNFRKEGKGCLLLLWTIRVVISREMTSFSDGEGRSVNC